MIHTANPVEHANNAMVQPNFINPVHHASVDLSGHNLVNAHQASGTAAPELFPSQRTQHDVDKSSSSSLFFKTYFFYVVGRNEKEKLKQFSIDTLHDNQAKVQL